MAPSSSVPSDRTDRSFQVARARRTACLFLLLTTVMAPAARAQTDTGREIRGRVLDPSGAVIVAAVVTPIGSGERPSIATDGAGRFVVAVDAGTRALRVSSPGFREVEVEVEVAAVANGRLEIVLDPEGVAQEVTVAATRVATPVAQLPNMVTVIDAPTLAARGAVSDDLPSLLAQQVPGFGPSLRKLTGRGESLRGRNPLYTVNGVPQHTPLRDGERDGHTIDLDFLERVEVVHGANAMQGIGATGGVVNLVTKAPYADGRWRQEAGVTLSGSAAFEADTPSAKAVYLAGRRVGAFDLIGGATVHRRGMERDANGDLVGLYPTQGDIMDSTQQAYYGRAGVAFTADQRLDVTATDFRLTRDGDFRPVAGNRAAGLPSGSVEGDPRPLVGDPARNTARNVSLEYTVRDLAGGALSVQGYQYRYRARFEGGTFADFALTTGGPAFLDQSEITADKLGAKLTYSLPGTRLAGVATTIGIDVTEDESAQVLARTNRVWVPYTTLRDAAPFVQVQRALTSRLLVNGGLRVEAAQLIVDDFTTIPSANSTLVRGGRPTFTDVLPNAGLVYAPFEAASFYGSYSEGFTMPDVGRVLRAVNRPGQSVSTLVDVEPVVTGNVEVGADVRVRAARVHVGYYRSTAERGSILDSTAEGIFRVRREPTRIDGVDITVQAPLTDALTAGGSYAHLRGRYDSNRDGLLDTDLDGLNVAPNRLNVFLQGLAGRHWSGRLQVSALLPRQFRGLAARTGRDFGGYTTADLGVAYTRQGLTLRLACENLLDRSYVTYFSQVEPAARNDTFFAGPGRAIRFGIEHRF